MRGSSKRLAIALGSAALQLSLLLALTVGAQVGGPKYIQNRAAGAVRRLLTRHGVNASFLSAPVSSQAALAALAVAAPLPQSNSLIVERRGHSATRLPDGSVLVLGGETSNGVVNGSEIFDPSTRAFSLGAAAAVARADHAALRLADGRVLVTGGRNHDGPLASTEIYDPAAGTFSEGPAMARARSGHTATLLSDGRVLVAGGDEEGTAEVFDAQAASVAALEEPLYAARSRHSALLLKDGKVLIVGGDSPYGNPVQTGEVFDPSGESFSAIPGAVSVPRTRPTLRELPGGLVQVIGGDAEGTMEIYVPSTDDFQAYAKLPATTPVADALAARTRSALFRAGQPDALLDRSGHTVTEIPQSNLALVAGGASGAGQILNTVAVLNSSTATVTTDKVDYAPGQLVTMTGTGFQPNEAVTIVLHEQQTGQPDRTFTSVADSQGNFTNTDFTTEPPHFGVTFVLTARGQSSGFVAQTSFTDAADVGTRVTLGFVFRSYGQTAPPIRVNFCRPITDGTNTCVGINDKAIEFTVDGEAVGSVVTSRQTINNVATDGIAVLPYSVLENFGGHTVVARFAGDETYKASQASNTLNIGKAQTLITWPSPAAVPYGTAIDSTQLNATIKDNTSNSQFTGQAVAGAFTYTLTTGSTPAPGYVPNAGTNSMRADFVPTDALNYANANRFNTLSVSKVPLTVTPHDLMRLYGQPNPELTGAVEGLRNSDPITATFATAATQASGVGSYPVTYTLSDPSNKLKNYTLPASPAQGTLAVNRAPLTLRADDKARPYGVDNPPLTFTYTGFVLGETAETPGVLGGAPSLTTTANAASDGGSYPITLSAGTLTANNYAPEFINATLTVTKAESVLNLSGLTQVYDGTPKAAAVTTSPAGLQTVTVGYSRGGVPVAAPTDAGEYRVTATLDNPNYESATAEGVLVINKAEQAIKFLALPDRTYGEDSLVTLNASASSKLFVGFEVVAGNATVNGNQLTFNGAGRVTVRATQAGNANYNAAAPVEQSFDVAKAPATINFDQSSLTQTYNGSARTPTVTTTPAGLSGLSVKYTQGGVEVPAPTNAGEYRVTATLDNQNYSAAEATATFVIGQATVQVSLQDATYTFDGKPHAVNSTVSGSAGQEIGTLTYTYTPQGDVGPDAVEPAVPNAPPGGASPVPPAPATTVLRDPPATPHLIVVFPERDFVSVENYSASDGQLTINVLRRSATGELVTVGSATATPQDDPTTPQFDGIAEVNHPGGSCWVGSTPDIRPGDIVRVTNAAGVADQTTVAHVSAGRPVQVNATTVRISGRAMDASGNPLPLDQIEQRLISSSADPFVLSGRRDLRAGGGEVQNGTLVYDDDDDPTHWTATYTNLTAEDVARALRVESRILWLGRNPGAENELTIFEIGDGVFGGPQAPCSAPLEGSTPVMPFPPPAAPAYASLNDPPATPHLIVVFPERDFVSIENYAQADGPVTINVLRRVTQPGGASTLRTVGSSTVELGDDPTTPQFDGLAEVNHPGGGCWVGSTPDIRPGDIVRVTTRNGVADQTTVSNVVAERVVQTSPNTVVVRGTAQDASGNPLPIDQIEQRMISSSADRFNVNGRRDIRAVAGGGEVGTLAYDAPGSIHWTATYTNLGSQDVARALRSETRILWLGRNTAAENELTIFETGDEVFGGPQAPCSAPLEGSDLPVWVGEYDVSVSLSGNPNFRVAADTARITITKATPVVNASGGPFDYDGQPHAATVAVVGINEKLFTPPDANTSVTYALTGSGQPDSLATGGPSEASLTAEGDSDSVVVGGDQPVTSDQPPVQSGTYEVRASFAGSRNYNAAEGSHWLTINNAAPVAHDQSLTTDEDKAILVSFSATDANADSLDVYVIRNPAYGTIGPIDRMLCALPLADAAESDTPQQQGGQMTCTARATYTPNANYNGTDTLTFRVNDGKADSNEATITINVNAVNDAPQVNAGVDVALNEGGTFSSTGSFSDADNAGTWTATVNYGDGAKPLPLNPDKTFTLSNVYTDSGNYPVTVTVTDNAGASSSDTAAVASANVAPAPAITGAPLKSPELTPITLGSTVSDPSAADTTAGFKYLWTVTKNGVAFAQNSINPGTLGMSSYTFTPDEEGNYVVTLKTTDKDGGSATASKTITVTNVEPSDDFNDNSIDTSRWTVGTGEGMVVAEQNQRLEIAPPTNGGTGYPGLYARTNINLTNRRATVEVVQLTGLAYGVETGFFLIDSATGNHLLFDVGGGGFLLQHKVNGVVSRNIIPFDAAQHRFWRFRHDAAADTVNWETSPDGLAWTVRRSVARPFPVTQLQGQLFAGKYTATTPSVTAAFDNYRVEDVPASPLMLTDDFNDNSLNTAKWNLDAPNTSAVTAVEQNQRLEITPSPQLTGYNGYNSLNTFNFTNAQAAVEVPQISAGSSNTLLRVGPNESDYLQIVTEGGHLCFQYWIGPSRSQTTTPYNAAQHRFWRIRHDPMGDTVVWETSADGASWVVQRSAARPMPLTSARVRLMAGKWTNTNSTAPGVAVFDNLVVERHRAVLAPSDVFNDNAVDPSLWTVLNTASLTTLREQNQRLEITLQPNTAAYNGVTSVPQTDFWNKTLSVEIPQATNAGGAWAETYFRLIRNDTNYFHLVITGANTFVLDAMTNGVRDRSSFTGYSPVTYRFWRFRHNAAAHTLNFESSADGNTWTTLKTAKVNFPLDNMRVILMAGAWGTGNYTPGMAVYDNLKLESNE
jgi:hypothetical protein